MILNTLNLQNFRSYERLEAEFDPGVNLIVGDNAQGKTNLLESIIYISQGSSYRTRKEQELIRWDMDYARMEAGISWTDRDMDIVYVLFQGDKRRQIMKNGVKQKSAAEMGSVISTVLFCPEDLQLLRSGASVRRKFLDTAIAQLRPNYRSAISAYQKLYDSKVRILREGYKKKGMLAALPDFNRQMAIIGASLIGYRARYCEKLGLLTEKYHDACSGGKEKLRLQYRTVSNIEDPFAPREELFSRLMEHQEEHYQAELESGRCLSGVFRDDFDVFLDDRPLKSYGSQGQTRTAAIALKLSEREIAAQTLGEEPLLLLDDVLSELDPGRQNFILNEIRSGQVFITCCEEDRLTAAGKTWYVRDHRLTEER